MVNNSTIHFRQHQKYINSGEGTHPPPQSVNSRQRPPALDLLKKGCERRCFTLQRGNHARDRSVPAGRSQLLISILQLSRDTSPRNALYLLICSCQGIVGYREGDFDFRYHMSYLFLYGNNLPFCVLCDDPVASPGDGLQSIHPPEKDFVVRSYAKKLQGTRTPFKIVR